MLMKFLIQKKNKFILKNNVTLYHETANVVYGDGCETLHTI